MNGINLLPDWYKEKTYYKAFIKKAAAVWAAVFICMGLSVYLLDYYIDARESELFDTAAESEDQKYLESEAIFNMLAETQRPAGDYGLPEKNNGVAVYLSLITAAAPDGVNMDEIGYLSMDGRFTFRGSADSGADFIGFLNNLEEYFFDVTLSRLSSDEEGAYAFSAAFYTGREETP